MHKKRKNVIKPILGVFLAFSLILPSYSEENEDLSKMSLEDLLNLNIDSTATLGSTTKVKIPLTVTTITNEMIKTSGARRLDELLEIFVPNFQVFGHNFGPNKLGLRGNVVSKYNKFIFTINGHVINNKVSSDVYIDFDSPALDEIKKIEVIRGPGSAIYGAGALNGVISITTYKPNELPTNTTTIKKGFGEKFLSAQTTINSKIDKNQGILLSGSIVDYEGASYDLTPIISGQKIDHKNVKAEVGKAANILKNPILPDRKSYVDKKFKLFGEYSNEDFDVWVRSARGGEWMEPARGLDTSQYNNWFSDTPENQVAIGYFYTIANAKYSKKISDNLNTEISSGYHLFEYARDVVGANNGVGEYRTTREDNYFTKGLLSWNINKENTLSTGLELNVDVFGLNGFTFQGKMNPENYDEKDIKAASPIVYSMISGLAEYNLDISKNFNANAGLRFDYHNIAGSLFSPRLTLNYLATEIDSIKFIANRSQRRMDLDILRKAENRKASPENETMNQFELRYQRFHDVNWSFSVGSFYIYTDLIEWNNNIKPQGQGANGANVPVGNYSAVGGELELAYQKDSNRFSLSQGLTKMLSFDMKSDGQDFTAAPYGYGNDFTNWSTNETKLNFRRQETKEFGYDGSIIAYWGFEGQKNWSDYNRVQNKKDLSGSEGYTGMTTPTILMNLGTSYKFSINEHNFTLRSDLNNALGWLYPMLNKRNVIKRTADFRLLAPSATISLLYSF